MEKISSSFKVDKKDYGNRLVFKYDGGKYTVSFSGGSYPYNLDDDFCDGWDDSNLCIHGGMNLYCLNMKDNVKYIKENLVKIKKIAKDKGIFVSRKQPILCITDNEGNITRATIPQTHSFWKGK